MALGVAVAWLLRLWTPAWLPQGSPAPVQVDLNRLADPRPGLAAQAAEQNRIRVLTWNTHGAGAAVLAMRLRERPVDVIALQEVSLSRRETNWLARTLGKDAVFLPLLYRWRPFGLAVLSGLPVREVYYQRLPSGFEPRAVLVVQTPALAVVNTHLEPSPRRRSQLEVLAEALRRIPGPAVLLGDLNEEGLGTYFPGFEDLGRHSGITYPNLNARIDYVLVRGYAGSAAEVRPAPPSDHHLVEATIYLAEGADL